MRTEALSRPSDRGEGGDAQCRRCGSTLATDQEWCLECGAARTLLRPPPGWRGPAAIVLTLIALAIVTLVVVLVSLSA